MSIAEKLTTVAENQPKVYDAGFKKAIERYAPEFTESGASVVCYPVEGFPLNVISQITPMQAGSGDPSPTNVRPLSAHTAVKVTIANDTESAEYNTEFGQAVYAGTFDWSTGLLTLTHKMYTVTGDELWYAGGSGVYTTTVNDEGILADSVQGTTNIYGFCSHVHNTGGPLSWSYLHKVNVTRGIEFGKFADGFWGEDLKTITVDKWKSYVKAQASAGTPIQIVYRLNEPITVQLTPQEIIGMSGTNTIHSDTGDTTVTGKGDGVAIVAELKDIIISLGGEV
jgi:hypothetical protein